MERASNDITKLRASYIFIWYVQCFPGDWDLSSPKIMAAVFKYYIYASSLPFKSISLSCLQSGINHLNELNVPAAAWETYTCWLCCWAMIDGIQLSWEKWLAEGMLLLLWSCCGFTLQIFGGSEVVVVFVLSEEVVYVPAPTEEGKNRISVREMLQDSG